jgi:hypothetical protein
MVNEADPPRFMPDEQEALDMVYRDSKALGGYIPDLMSIMRKNVAGELDAANRQALTGILGHLQLMTRILMMILLLPRYHDHEDLIATFNGYRQTLKFVEEYLAGGARS